MFIQNCSMKEIQSGDHFDCGDRAVLIQIMDPCKTFPIPKRQFQEIHQFEFLDSEDETGDIAEFCCTSIQAATIVDILKSAHENKQHVVVHCHAGLCRSGAVAEVGIIMGFQDTEKFRLPNVLVKKRMMQALGLTYDENENCQESWTTDSELITALMREYGS